VPNFGTLLPEPLTERRGVPLYYRKSLEETKRDVYERYDDLVTRQTALHLADELYGGYPLQPLSDYVHRWLSQQETITIADLGCSVGRLIGDMATIHPQWDCYGIDFSYQMLRQAKEYWLDGRTLTPNLLRFGYPPIDLPGRSLANLRFALADATALPFSDAKLDFLFNTFLIDRLDDPLLAFREWWRVLKPGGRLVTVSPLNYLKLDQWKKYYPPMKLVDGLLGQGWKLIDLTDPLLLREPMDARGNAVEWKTVALVLDRPVA
jgi:ubiquinone/menaquinone biosynthesis C-methylase UbiE